MIPTTTHISYIDRICKEEGIQIADKVNKMALEAKRITTETYLAAARILVKAYLDQSDK